jgi:hypothetical protein
MQLFRVLSLLTVAAAAVVISVACGSSEEVPPPPADAGAGGIGERSGEPAGATCTQPSQCYPGVDGGSDAGLIQGQVTCLTKIPNGYCTHVCTQDTNCCAAPGECRTSVKQVCSPLENQPEKYCFLSCDDADIARAIAANGDAGYYDGGVADGGVGDAYCKSFAGTSTTCRSSGGGSERRKVCIPKE